MKILELFSGTHSIAKAFPDDEVISVDIDNHFKPTHNISIFDFDYKQYNHFDYIHASPPCLFYSTMNNCWYNRRRKINGEFKIFTKELHKQLVEDVSDKLVSKALEIIEYFKPEYWTMENPYSNSQYSLKNRDIVKHLDYTITDYCMYGHCIKKPTMFFNNFGLELKRCDKNHTHVNWGYFCDNGNPKTNYGGKRRIYDRYVIPHELCVEIKNQIK